jgi:hypothetical protein
MQEQNQNGERSKAKKEYPNMQFGIPLGVVKGLGMNR